MTSVIFIHVTGVRAVREFHLAVASEVTSSEAPPEAGVTSKLIVRAFLNQSSLSGPRLRTRHGCSRVDT
jgi:hypothetical protein